jgi:ABC-2 type transport system permease protein
MNSLNIQRELLGISAVWWREFKVFWREKSRIVSSIVQPLMWLFLFGSGIGASLSVGSVNYRDYIYPGILTMSVIFGSVFFGLYIIWDRKLDVLKAVLVAPVTRISIFLEKCWGDALMSFCRWQFCLRFLFFFRR